jgi:hypothetical protein
MARDADPLTYAASVTYAYGTTIPAGVLKPDDFVMHEIEEALHGAERSGDDFALAHAQVTLAIALVHRPTVAERHRGEQLLAEVHDTFLRDQHHLGDLAVVDAYLAREMARRGDRERAIPLLREANENVVRDGQLLGWGIITTAVLVETLLDRAADGDLAKAQTAIDRLATAPTNDRHALRDIVVLRLRALLARAHGDNAAYADLKDRYRDMAKALGFEGHIAWADAMP